MGLLEAVRQLLGVGAEAAATRDADPDDLFGMSTGHVTMAAELGFDHCGEAALCFADVDTTGFEDAVEEARAILDTAAQETGAVADFHEDEYGYRWIVVEAATPEELVSSVYFGADTLIENGFGPRLHAAVFGFEATERATAPTGSRVYWIYSFQRGAFYPFAPRDNQTRAEDVELKLSGVLDGELSVEADRSHWYPLWPDDGPHPWD